MGNLFYILGELLIILGGFYCVLIYGGFYKIKYKTEASKDKFETLKNKRGTFYIILGVALMLYGGYNIFSRIL